MTWGRQNTEAEAHEQLSYAFDNGINFMDTAEMYPIPPDGKTKGLTDLYIGTWMKNRKREDIILATKVTAAEGGGDSAVQWLVDAAAGAYCQQQQAVLAGSSSRSAVLCSPSQGSSCWSIWLACSRSCTIP
jgi:aryl-alcohol dehydrogenase-like predicted oxidoreductase